MSDQGLASFFCLRAAWQHFVSNGVWQRSLVWGQNRPLYSSSLTFHLKTWPPNPLSEKTVTPTGAPRSLQMTPRASSAEMHFCRSQRWSWRSSARLSLALQMANGMFSPAPCSLARLLPRSLTVMLIQTAALEPTLARHSRVGKAEGELARSEIGAIYFMLAPAACKVM